MFTPKRYRAGSITLVALTLTYSVTFSTPLGSAAYRVAFQPIGLALGGTPLSVAKTASGFTVSMASLAVGGSLDWVAIEDC